LRILFLVLVIIILIPTLSFNAFASHHHKQIANIYKCTYPHTTLYVYTQPVQKECVILMHNGHVVNAAGVPEAKPP
jgi:hypothetical protein